MTSVEVATADLPPVWPAGPALVPAGDPSILITRFPDTAHYHPGLIARILELEQDPRFARRYVGCGGSKVHRIELWDCPEAALIDERAKALFRAVMRCEEAVVDLSWANIYRKGDYCMPHSHERSIASIIYCVDAGDDDPLDPVSGRLFFADPRLDGCCKPTRAYMTSPLFPAMAEGSMVIFPSQIVHCVNPYAGLRPRITLSWNINRVSVPGAPLPD